MPSQVPPPLIARVSPGQWRALDRVAAGSFGIVVAAALAKTAHGWAGWSAVLVGVCVFAWPIAGRRDHPVVSLALVSAAAVAVTVVAPRWVVLGLVPLGCVLYTVAADRRPRVAVVGLAVALATAIATALPDFRHNGAAVLFSLIYVTVWTIGFAVGMHRRYTENLLRGQAALAEARLETARRRLTEQRMRIARELHDVVAHQMSVITVQAAYGGLVAVQDPERARAALSVIETAGREALTELRRTLGVLRSTELAGADGAQDIELGPAPGLGDLDQLVAAIANAGVRVDVTTTGQPRPLPPGIDLAAYRIIQEALTNVVKHAASPTARVRVEHRRELLVLEITDRGSGHDQKPPAAGHGLTGMRERASLYGGDVDTGWLTEGGFRVTARLPLPAAAPTAVHPSKQSA